VKALLDTHAFLWAIAEEGKLSRRAQQIDTSSNDFWLSVTRVWEILIKVRMGKLLPPDPVGTSLTKELAKNRIEVLPIQLDHMLKTESLPLHHRDPFDRLLIAQSIEEGWPIITSDPWFAHYPIDVIW